VTFNPASAADESLSQDERRNAAGKAHIVLFAMMTWITPESYRIGGNCLHMPFRADILLFLSALWVKKEKNARRLRHKYLLKRNTAMAENDIDLKQIKELIEIMKQNGLEELEIMRGDNKIFLKKSQPQSYSGPIITSLPVMKQESAASGATSQTGQASGTTPPVADNLVAITSPIVGTFYAKPSPDSEPFVEIGSPIGPQTVVCIIEAMKVMNEIKAETSGTIVEAFVNDGQAVEYGQVLFKVRPD
jgi:acetyl-CoA carboxylase biotin carboxyl carrier protein